MIELELLGNGAEVEIVVEDPTGYPGDVDDSVVDGLHGEANVLVELVRIDAEFVTRLCFHLP